MSLPIQASGDTLATEITDGALADAPVGLALFDNELRYRAVNATLARINGLPVDAHLGRFVRDVSPQLGDDTFSRLQHVLATGETLADQEVSFPVPAAPGVARWWLESFAPTRDPGGAVSGVLATVVDITRQKQAELAAARAQARATALIEFARRLGATVSLEAACTTIAQGAGDVSGASQVAVLLEDDRGLRLASSVGMSGEPLAALVDRLSEPGSIARRVMDAVAPRFLASPDAIGDEPWPEITGAAALLPVPGREQAVGVLWLGYDEAQAFPLAEVEHLRVLDRLAGTAIERMRAREGERRTARFLENVLAQLPLGISVVDASGARTTANSRLREIWRGDRPSTAVDEYAEWTGFHRDGRAYLPEEWPLARSLQRGEVVVAEEIDIIRFDGTRGTIALSSSPVHQSDDSLIGAVALVEDITARREAEATREVSLGVLSHELRTPVTIIQGIGERLLARPKLAEEQRQDGLADIVAEAHRLVRAIDDLLVLSRVERGLDLVRRDPVQVQHVVRGVIADMERRWPGRSLILTAEGWLPTVAGDDGYVDHVVRNLLANAAKYAPDGPIEIRLEQSPDEVRVRVLDEGPGFASGEEDRVFDLFYRSPSRARAAPGAGIGLYVVRALVEAQGGRVWALTRPEGGAEVGFCLASYTTVAPLD